MLKLALLTWVLLGFLAMLPYIIASVAINHAHTEKQEKKIDAIGRTFFKATIAWIVASAAAMLLLARHDHIHGHVDQAETELMITVVIFALGLVWAGLGWLPILAITRGA